MNYLHVGTAYGREIYIVGDEFEIEAKSNEELDSPSGYSAAAVILPNDWQCDSVGWFLNSLYGALSDWTEFNANSGARSFAFFGERSEAASELCDVLAYAWTQGAEVHYDQILSSWQDDVTLLQFIENQVSGAISVGDAFADNLKNTIFAVMDAEQLETISDAIRSVVRDHRFD